MQRTESLPIGMYVYVVVYGMYCTRERTITVYVYTRQPALTVC